MNSNVSSPQVTGQVVSICPSLSVANPWHRVNYLVKHAPDWQTSSLHFFSKPSPKGPKGACHVEPGPCSSQRNSDARINLNLIRSAVHGALSSSTCAAGNSSSKLPERDPAINLAELQRATGLGSGKHSYRAGIHGE